MKIIAFLCLALLCIQARVATPQKVDMSAGQVAEILEGLLAGYFEGEFPLKECITDAEVILEDFEKAIFYFKQGMTISNIGEAFKYFGDAALKIPSTVKECESCAGIV